MIDEPFVVDIKVDLNTDYNEMWIYIKPKWWQIIKRYKEWRFGKERPIAIGADYSKEPSVKVEFVRHDNISFSSMSDSVRRKNVK